MTQEQKDTAFERVCFRALELRDAIQCMPKAVRGTRRVRGMMAGSYLLLSDLRTHDEDRLNAVDAARNAVERTNTPESWEALSVLLGGKV